MEAHLANDCQKVPIDCEYVLYGCKQRFKREETAYHNQRFGAYHCQCLSLKLRQIEAENDALRRQNQSLSQRNADLQHDFNELGRVLQTTDILDRVDEMKEESQNEYQHSIPINANASSNFNGSNANSNQSEMNDDDDMNSDDDMNNEVDANDEDDAIDEDDANDEDDMSQEEESEEEDGSNDDDADNAMLDEDSDQNEGGRDNFDSAMNDISTSIQDNVENQYDPIIIE